MASSDSDPESVVLRPSWHATAAIGPIVAVLLVPLALVFGDSVAQAVVYAVVVGAVFAFVDGGTEGYACRPTARTSGYACR